jgi:hypothetical protein
VASSETAVHALPLDKRQRPSYDEFVEKYLIPHKPLIISGALDDWAALKWTPEYFRQQYPALLLKINGTDFRMADFVELILNSDDQHPAPYLRNEIVDHFLPALLPDIHPMPVYFSDNWLDDPLTRPLDSRFDRGRAQFFLGGKGGKFPFLHFDGWHSHAFICQIYGTKEFTLYSPDQTPYLYVRPKQYNASQIPDIEHPDYDKYPLFARASAVRFRIEPGEILFIPGGWWHSAKMTMPSITISVNRVNASNWGSLTGDFCATAPAHLKPLVWAYLSSVRVLRTLRGS